MKKVISIVVLFSMLAASLPVFADEKTGAELEKVLLCVKEKIDIPAELEEFESSSGSYSEKIFYDFTWHDKNYDKSVSVTADERGFITSYYNHSEKVSEKKITGFSKNEIISFAGSFIQKALPEMNSDITDVLVLNEASYSTSSPSRYSFTYERYKNSVPVKDNYVNITVCISENNSLYVRNMSANINYAAEFEEQAAEIESFVQKYTEAFPIELVYENEYNYNRKAAENRVTPVLIYRVKDNNAGFISAETGEIINEDSDDEILFRNEASADMSAGGSSQKNAALTEKELVEISQVEGLLSVEKIEKKVKALPYIRFPEGVKLENSSLSKNDDGDYIYNLYYSGKNDNSYNYLSMSVYAKDGKLLNYSCSNESDLRNNGELTENQKKAAKVKAEEFLSAAAAEEMKASEYEQCDFRNNYLTSRYRRMINGIKHINDSIRVTFDGKNSVVTGFSLSFTKGEFTNPEEAVDSKYAYDKLIEYSPVIKMYVKSGGKYVKCFTLEKWGVSIDGITGEIKNTYKDENEGFSYNDISGHWVEQAANALSEIQVGIKSESLLPDTSINQEEYLRLLASGMYGNYYHNYSQEELYESLIREKVITEEEKNPLKETVREEAFVYLIRMANLERVAKLENIYKVDFADEEKLSSGKLGHCAILYGMGVLTGDGGNLRPSDNLTRAEAIVMLYRYLLAI